jgi:hypothetical protein
LFLNVLKELELELEGTRISFIDDCVRLRLLVEPLEIAFHNINMSFPPI